MAAHSGTSPTADGSGRLACSDALVALFSLSAAALFAPARTEQATLTIVGQGLLTVVATQSM